MSTIETEYVYGLRTCKADGSSHNGFVWPTSGMVECPDWRDDDSCGGGLHFLMAGQNGPGVWYGRDKDARWLILRVRRGEYRTGKGGELAGKAKARRAEVVHCGTRESAMAYLSSAGCPGPWFYGIATAGNNGQATAGDHGQATAGYHGQATVGYGGHAMAGNGGVISITYYDGARPRLAVGYIGEDGILPNVAYCVRDGKLVKA